MAPSSRSEDLRQRRRHLGRRRGRTPTPDNGGASQQLVGRHRPGPQVRGRRGLPTASTCESPRRQRGNPFWPAAYAQFLVASTDSGDNLSWFSTHGNCIDMAAPGESIWNLWVGDSTASLSGTSMASPHVCGAGALVRTVNPQLTNFEARVTLRLAADDLGTPGYDDSFGFGRLDIKKAVDAAASIQLSTRDVTPDRSAATRSTSAISTAPA